MISLDEIQRIRQRLDRIEETLYGRRTLDEPQKPTEQTSTYGEQSKPVYYEGNTA